MGAGKSTSLRGRELKCYWRRGNSHNKGSTSLRGRELKWLSGGTFHVNNGRPPCEVVSWNDDLIYPLKGGNRRPPCEVVSWNIQRMASVRAAVGRPPCEVVSWNASVIYQFLSNLCRPPCEVVSWNYLGFPLVGDYLCRPPCEVVSWNYGCVYFDDESMFVDLLARSWVEMANWNMRLTPAVVDLLARSWVEMWRNTRTREQRWSTSLRGSELKWISSGGLLAGKESTSLRGRELKSL